MHVRPYAPCCCCLRSVARPAHRQGVGVSRPVLDFGILGYLHWTTRLFLQLVSPLHLGKRDVKAMARRVFGLSSPPQLVSNELADL